MLSRSQDYLQISEKMLGQPSQPKNPLSLCYLCRANSWKVFALATILSENDLMALFFVILIVLLGR